MLSFTRRTDIICNIMKVFERRYSSALYLTGQKAQGTYAVVKPHLDLDERMETENLEENFRLRGLNVNLKRLKSFWEMYKMMEEQKTVLQVTRTEIGKLIAKLMEDEVKYKSEIVELKTKAKLVKNDFLNVRDYTYGLEETVALGILDLPNVLHPSTPQTEERVIHSYLEKPAGISKPHLDIARENNLVEYISPMFYFLTGDAALFEVGITKYAVDSLKKLNYVPFSNADFSRSVVVEGCGTDFTDNTSVFTLDDPHEKEKSELCQLHLTGGGSVYSFMAYFTKHSVQRTYLPLKLFAQGRIYQPIKNVSYNSFFHLNQYSVVTPFIATLDTDDSLNQLLEETQRNIISLYEKLGHHFRIVYLPAKELTKVESLRLSIQMFSNNLQNYVEVGYISAYDSYLSKRLLFTCEVSKERKFPKVLSGPVLNVQKFLACALENNSLNNQPLLCNLIKTHLPV